MPGNKKWLGKFPTILKLYWAIWLGAFTMALVLPMTANTGYWYEAAGLSAVYVIWSSVVAYVCSGRTSNIGVRKPTAQRRKPLLQLTLLVTFLGVSGVLLLYTDRVYYQGIDYTESIAIAREQWRVAGEERQSVSSMFSVLGNVMWGFSVVGLVLLGLQWEAYKPAMAWTLAGVNLLTVQAFGILGGGRTPVLVLFTILVAVVCVRDAVGLPLIPRISFVMKCVVAGASLLFLGFTLYVVSERVRVGNIEPREYLLSGATELLGKETDNFPVLDKIAESTSNDIYLYCHNAVQLIHSFWVFQNVIFLEDRSGFVLISFPLAVLDKLSLLGQIPRDWEYSGLFISLPGGWYYDLGFFGLLVGATLHGLALANCIAILNSRSITGWKLIWILSVFVTTILSPILTSFVVGSYWFVFASFGATLTVNRVVLDYNA